MSNPVLTISAEWQPYVSQGMGDASLDQNNRTGKGYARYSVSGVARTLTSTPDAGVSLPTLARHAWISIQNAAVRIRTDATNPTTAEGVVLPAGTLLQVENQRSFLLNLGFVCPSGTAEVTVNYFA